MSLPLLAELRDQAARAGMNLFGLVDAHQFDGSQPSERRTGRFLADCGTIIVLGNGGHGPAPAGSATRQLASLLRRRERCVVLTPGPRAGISFVRLAEAAGFGIVSPVSGLLLHPQFGPWIRLRAALLVARTPFGSIADASLADRFNPCCVCARPCLAACPALAHDDHGRHDSARCDAHRQGGGCETGCARQIACPIGSEQQVGQRQMHQHAMTTAGARAWLGIGLRGLVQRFWGTRGG